MDLAARKHFILRLVWLTIPAPLVATAIAYGCDRLSTNPLAPPGWLDLGFVALEAVFFVTSRDTLRKYYTRAGQLLGIH